MEEQQYFERVDGKLYVWGSPEHGRAIDAEIKRTFDRIDHSGDLARRFDSAQKAFLAKDLVYKSLDVQRILHGRLRMSEFVEIRSETPRGAHTTEYRTLDSSGEAEPRALGADDAPAADVNVEAYDQPVVDIPGSYSYTLKDLEAAAFTGTPLPAWKAEACADMLARAIDKILREGHEASGITGFLNDPNVPAHTVTHGDWIGSSTTTTSDQIITDVQGALMKIKSQSLDNHTGKRMLLPLAYDGRLDEPRANTDTSIKKWLIGNTTLEMIDGYAALDSASGPSGVTDPPFGVVYDPDPINVYADVPVPYEEIEAQVRNFAWVVNARSSVAGIKWKRPFSAVYMEALD